MKWRQSIRLAVFTTLAALVSAVPQLMAQSLPDTTTARNSATDLRGQADLLGTRADSLAKSAAQLITRADSILLAAGLKIPPKPDHWNGNFGLGYTLNRGNSEQTSLITTFDTGRTGETTRFTSHSSVTSTSNEGGEKTNKGSTKNKFELEHSERFFYFAALDADYNRQAGIDLRLSPGAGVGLAVLAQKKLRLAFNFGANPVTELLRGQPNRTKGHYLASEALEVQLNGRTRLTQNVSWKPRFDKTEDYLLNFGITLASQLTRSFDLKMTLEGKYDSRPPVRLPAVKRQDWMFFTSISYNLW
jgi:putative salt-induced outer membrane protein YdiY